MPKLQNGPKNEFRPLGVNMSWLEVFLAPLRKMGVGFLEGRFFQAHEKLSHTLVPLGDG
jgi:hypothetical protein